MNQLYQKLRILPIAVLTISMGSAGFGAGEEQAKPDSEQISSLLDEVQVRAAMLREDASFMESYARSGASWESHSAKVDRIREHINAAGRQLTQLQSMREEGSPWQRTAIDRIHPLLKELAENTGTVIRYLTENPKRLFTREYKTYLEANADLSSELASMISDFVEYGNTKHRLDGLADKLELDLEVTSKR